MDPIPTTTAMNDEAAEFFDELSQAYSLVPDYLRVYERFAITFRRLLDQGVAGVTLKFAGDYAKTDYLLQEHKATRGQAYMVNAVRSRLRRCAVADMAELSSNCRNDLRAIAVFVGIIYGVDVPAGLKALYPDSYKQASEPRPLSADYVRMIVDEWDDHYICGKIDYDGISFVRVSYEGKYGNGLGFGYLKSLLYRGAQLNLVSPVAVDGVVKADFIVFEPDVLVDITAVARCFADYGSTPLAHLLDKISPNITTPAIVLGNLAGQLLDDEINLDPAENSFADSVKKFYQRNALLIATSGVVDQRDAFFTNARDQKRNINRALRQTLPATVSRFSPTDIILEPSFLSEMLGLQGRMDFMQLDKKIIIEQKSGNCRYPHHEGEPPRQTDSHYVQVLLYRLLVRYNYSDDYKRNGGVQTFLLYSKFKDSLCGLGSAPQLEHKAMEIRNHIASLELRCAQEGFGCLDSLSPSDFIPKDVKSNFFDRYIKPRIEQTLAPLHACTPLEHAYVMRLMRFVEAEHILSKLGNRTKSGSGFASIWHDTLADKRRSGSIYDSLSMEALPERGPVTDLTLRFNNVLDDDISNFRVGDIVILYPYVEGKEPDARRSVVFRCSITAITAARLRLSLRYPQSDPHVFTYSEPCLWAVEHDFIESSYGSLYRGVYSFLTAPKVRRDLILMQREPQYDTSLTLKGDYGDFNDLMLRVLQAKDLFLIMGPPGTGKTSFGLLNTLREQLLWPGTSVLLMAYTNRAVDEICSKLTNSGIRFIRIGSEAACADEYKPCLMQNMQAEGGRLSDFVNMLGDVRVYVGTTTAINSNMSLFSLKTFDLAIIDEASQILEPHIIALLSAADNRGCSIKKFVLIGDHKQLPAVVQQQRAESAVTEPELRAVGLTDCRNSLFQRFIEAYGHDPHCAYMLTRQGRMHHEIAEFPNLRFYGGRLREVPLDGQLAALPCGGADEDGLSNLLTMRRVAFLAVRGVAPVESEMANQDEADVIAALVNKIYLLNKNNFNGGTVGVIVPYRNQIATIRNTLERTYGVEAFNLVTIDTVERYQGSQRRYIIYGFTVNRRHQLGFLTETSYADTDGAVIDRKLNVAMTRATDHLIMVGNPDVLAHDDVYADLMSYVKSCGGWFDVPKERLLCGGFTVNPS